eukprot:TRINITY_DN28565_c0_g1_i1.p3 TRINITY_DN28565_c0_g1~~TRINITY_DN28565_c0_g1_i1.p3  ORF type:complete len:124 (-),score=5.83 TRINITY_DN28565_c0_g1_i1:482-853(-)
MTSLSSEEIFSSKAKTQFLGIKTSFSLLFQLNSFFSKLFSSLSTPPIFQFNFSFQISLTIFSYLLQKVSTNSITPDFSIFPLNKTVLFQNSTTKFASISTAGGKFQLLLIYLKTNSFRGVKQS